LPDPGIIDRDHPPSQHPLTFRTDSGFGKDVWPAADLPDPAEEKNTPTALFPGFGRAIRPHRRLAVKTHAAVES